MAWNCKTLSEELAPKGETPVRVLIVFADGSMAEVDIVEVLDRGVVLLRVGADNARGPYGKSK